MLMIDAFAFCRSGEQQAGKLALPELVRMRAECVSDEGAVEWKLVGKAHANGYPMFHLVVSGTVSLICQRCLAPFEFHFHSDTRIILAKDEASADEIEASLDDDEIEVAVGSKTFDIVALVEDEALLALPLSPKHEVCPAKEKLDAFATAKKESPFAALKGQLAAKKSG